MTAKIAGKAVEGHIFDNIALYILYLDSTKISLELLVSIFAVWLVNGRFWCEFFIHVVYFSLGKLGIKKVFFDSEKCFMLSSFPGVIVTKVFRVLRAILFTIFIQLATLLFRFLSIRDENFIRWHYVLCVYIRLLEESCDQISFPLTSR